MATRLSTRATEGSTYVVTASFTDEDGNAETPTAITWTLTDDDGNVVNEREDVPVETPAASVEIVLSGDDLDAGGREAAELIMTVNATYDSDLGSDLPLVDQCRIVVVGLERT